MPETEVETPAPPANETVKEEAVKADADNATEEKKDEEKPSEETKTKEAEAKEPKPKKEKKPKEPAPPPPPAVHKKDFEKEVVYVYQFNRTATVPSISPACLKLETWLKLNGIKFEVKISKRCKFSFLSRLMDGPQRCHPCLLAFFLVTLVIPTVLCLAVATSDADSAPLASAAPPRLSLRRLSLSACLGSLSSSSRLSSLALSLSSPHCSF